MSRFGDALRAAGDTLSAAARNTSAITKMGAVAVALSEVTHHVASHYNEQPLAEGTRTGALLLGGFVVASAVVDQINGFAKP